jgi:hypothetical protein
MNTIIRFVTSGIDIETISEKHSEYKLREKKLFELIIKTVHIDSLLINYYISCYSKLMFTVN